MLISSSVLGANILRVEEAFRAREALTDWVHVDIMDGSFVPNISFGQGMTQGLRALTKKPLDVHFMVRDVVPMLDEFAALGADMMTVHAEAVTHLHRTLEHIRSLGVKAGVALNPATPPCALEYLMDSLDMVLVMTVDPGYGGQKLIPAMLDKARAVRKMIDRSGKKVLLQVDGGVHSGNLREIAGVGVDVVVAGSSFFGAEGEELARLARAL